MIAMPQAPACCPPLFTACREVVLASASPRRQQFLREWGLAFRVVRPKGVEPKPAPGEPPDSYALRAAMAKAEAGRALALEGVLIAADTVVALEGDILGKPHDDAEALHMLYRLRGREHTVTSAVSLLWDGQTEHFSDSAHVRFHNWDDATLAAYVATGEPRDKAGAYAIQGQGAFLASGIQGSWATVVGLPVGLLAQRLLRHGLVTPATPL